MRICVSFSQVVAKRESMLALLGAAATACGSPVTPTAPAVETSATNGSASSPVTAEAPIESEPAEGAHADPRAKAGAELPAPDPHRHRSIRATQFEDELKALGHEPAGLLPLAQVPVTQKFETMQLIAKSLGVECTHCHVSQEDFRSDTPNKRIARRMWDQFVVEHSLESGPLFCDSCHQGSAKILQRERKKDVKAYMRTEYSKLRHSKLSSADGALECRHCHQKPMQPQIFEKLWGIARAAEASKQPGASLEAEQGGQAATQAEGEGS